MNRILTCMVVDDEPSAQKVLLQYIADAPQLQAGPVCSDALEALEKLRQEKVDLLLLDVNMPRLSGISLLRSLDDPPPVILTTAYDDYALEGYELDLVDYLLKPFSFERFLKAVRKAEERTGREGSAEKFLMVKADKKSWKVDLEEILYIESLGDYVTVHTPIASSPPTTPSRTCRRPCPGSCSCGRTNPTWSPWRISTTWKGTACLWRKPRFPSARPTEMRSNGACRPKKGRPSRP